MTDPRVHFFRYVTSTPGRSRRVVSWATGQPGWVARAASVAMLLVLLLLVLVLVIPALLIGVVVFFVLSVYVTLRIRLAAWRAGREISKGRKNVHVIHRDR